MPLEITLLQWVCLLPEKAILFKSETHHQLANGDLGYRRAFVFRLRLSGTSTAQTAINRLPDAQGDYLGHKKSV